MIGTLPACPFLLLDPQLLSSEMFSFFLLCFIADPVWGRVTWCLNLCHDAQRKYLLVLRTSSVLCGRGGSLVSSAASPTSLSISVATSSSVGSRGLAPSRTPAPRVEHDLPVDSPQARRLAEAFRLHPGLRAGEGTPCEGRACRPTGSEGPAVHWGRGLSAACTPRSGCQRQAVHVLSLWISSMLVVRVSRHVKGHSCVPIKLYLQN